MKIDSSTHYILNILDNYDYETIFYTYVIEQVDNVDVAEAIQSARDIYNDYVEQGMVEDVPPLHYFIYEALADLGYTPVDTYTEEA